MKIITSFKKRILTLLSKICVRDNRIWITGSHEEWFKNSVKPPQFVDNSKYLYLYILKNTDYKVFWLTEDKELIKKMNTKNLPALYKWSLKGLYMGMKAGVFFYHYGPSQVNEWLMGEAIKINLWHGIPLKKIGNDIKKEKDKKILKNEYLISSSKYVTEKTFKSAFSIEEKNILSLGYPRTDIFKMTKEEIKNNFFEIDIDGKNIKKFIEKIEKYSKVYMYMPTWRDEDANYLFKAGFDLEKLNKVLESKNEIFIFKLHHLTNISFLENKKYSNIIIFDNLMDVYPVLPFTDILITDYSSIYFDYLLLDKEIIFFDFDLKSYMANRPLYFNYKDMTPGIKVQEFEELLKIIEKSIQPNFRSERERLKELIFQNYDYKSSENIFNHFKKLDLS